MLGPEDLEAVPLLEDKIRNRDARVGIVGIGYVGLPLSLTVARAGFRVTAFDIDREKVESLNAGKSYIEYIPDSDIAGHIESGQFEATDDFDRLSEVDTILICVPTPLREHNEPDLSFVVSTAESIAQRLRRGQLIVLESTTYPGTTQEVLKPILEKGGLQCGRDFFLAYSPEREDPANKDYSTFSIPKLVGGVDAKSGELAALFYSAVVEKAVPLSGAREAEAAKILENVYRSVNIALVNELKVIFDKMGIDIWEVITAARTKPFGFQAFYPGPGLGGHCVPIDPFYLAWKAREFGQPTRFIELAGEINRAMPEYVVTRLVEALNEKGKHVKGSRILVLGVSYKKDVGDTRESPALPIIDALRHHGAQVAYHDPHVGEIPGTRQYPDMQMKSTELTASVLQFQDAVLVITGHSSIDYEWLVENSTLVVDTRNACESVRKHRDRIVKA
jgi:UDP-N-acetyl-D-glucosamine dehydrogenase